MVGGSASTRAPEGGHEVVDPACLKGAPRAAICLRKVPIATPRAMALAVVDAKVAPLLPPLRVAVVGPAIPLAEKGQDAFDAAPALREAAAWLNTRRSGWAKVETARP